MLSPHTFMTVQAFLYFTRNCWIVIQGFYVFCVYVAGEDVCVCECVCVFILSHLIEMLSEKNEFLI